MVELKARLYDIGEELEALRREREELIKSIKEKAYVLAPQSFLPTLTAKTAELQELNSRLLKNLYRSSELLKEQSELKAKLGGALMISINRVTNARVWIDGTAFIARAEEVDLPKVKYKTTALKALGLVGEPELHTIRLSRVPKKDSLTFFHVFMVLFILS